MNAIPFYRVSAFAAHPFEGNPAGVCITEAPLSQATMAAIARENGLSETAFLVGDGTRYHIRWFSPAAEVDLCGHATLASAHAIASFVAPGARRIEFDSPLAGHIPVEQRDGLWWMDFPARPHQPCSPPAGLDAGLRSAWLETHAARFLLVVVEDERTVRAVTPDLAWVASLPWLGVVVTSAGARPGVDFVSRYFVPQVGIDEDPVSGGTHCVLAPFWAERLGRTSLAAGQVSRRGGSLRCEVRGDRVHIGGRAVVFQRGELLVPEVPPLSSPTNS
jgi:predicted PhzF superfamily epimerase YddE/YHI9